MSTMIQGAKATGQSERDNWLTPPYIWEAIEKMFDSNFLDPCPVNYQQVWKYGLTGLDIVWHSKTYINPPFSQYSKWVEHGLKQQYGQIWMAHHNHDTRWFRALLDDSTAICLLKDRVRFINPATGEPSKSTAIGKCQSLIYRGHEPERFYNCFKRLGTIVMIKQGGAMSTTSSRKVADSGEGVGA